MEIELETVESDFVNRRYEIDFLTKLVADVQAPSAFVVVRAPSGYGKSSLTSEFARVVGGGDLAVSVVDPLIRMKSGDAKVYDGYFVQRCAAALSASLEQGVTGIPDFAAYLAGRRWVNVKEKDAWDAVRTLPGPASVYKLAVEYAERFFSFGRRDPKIVLNSDAGDAVAACRAYVELVMGATRTLIVVREAQHIDHESIRVLVQANRLRSGSVLIFEYTAPDGAFDPDHQKILGRELQGHANAHILDLMRLERGHFEQLLRRLALSNTDLTGDFYGRWNGNLRVLEELQYSVSVGRQITGPADLGDRLGDLSSQIEEHLSELTTRQRMVLALIVANVEPIAKNVLLAAARTISPEGTAAGFADDLEALQTEHGFVDVRSEQVSLKHEDLAGAIGSAPGGRGAIARAEKALRDHYVGLIRDRDFSVVSLAAAARRAFQLCASTGDVALLTRLTGEINEQMRAANDQAAYVDVVVETVAAQHDMLPSERRRLVDWAGALAYDICDFTKATALIESLSDRTARDDVLLAHCYTEAGRHDEARAITAALRKPSADPGIQLAADLTDGGVALDAGDWGKGRVLLNQVIEAGTPRNDALVGHAWRLLAEMQPYPDCTNSALASVAWFDRCGLKKSMAYSALSASRFLARTGRFTEAVDLVDAADAALRGAIRNEHLLLNDRAMVGLLAPSPDFDRCAEWLRQGLRSSRYDFGDLVLLTNLAIAHWKRGDMESALDCVARCEIILDDPDFAERDVYWPTSFNLGNVLDAAGKLAAAEAMRERARRTGWSTRSDDAYWAYRFGESQTPEPSLAYLYRFDYHPEALSHWNVDLECLERLRAG